MRRIEHPLFLLFTVALVGMLGTFVLSIGAAGESTGEVGQLMKARGHSLAVGSPSSMQPIITACAPAAVPSALRIVVGR